VVQRQQQQQQQQQQSMEWSSEESQDHEQMLISQTFMEWLSEKEKFEADEDQAAVLHRMNPYLPQQQQRQQQQQQQGLGGSTEGSHDQEQLLVGQDYMEWQPEAVLQSWPQQQQQQQQHGLLLGLQAVPALGEWVVCL
jgi:hypothetical protein